MEGCGGRDMVEGCGGRDMDPSTPPFYHSDYSFDTEALSKLIVGTKTKMPC